MKNTQGPWMAYFVPGEPITSSIQPGRRQDEWRIDTEKVYDIMNPSTNGVSIIASVHGPDMEANAKLIAAAPELLVALQKILRHIPDDKGGCSLSADIALAKAAIKKAKG